MNNQRLIRQFDNRTGKTYFYTEERFTDPETGETKVKRHIAGKLAEDGSIIPTGKKGRTKKNADDASYKEKYNSLLAQLRQKEEEVRFLRDIIRNAVEANDQLVSQPEKQKEMLTRLLEQK